MLDGEATLWVEPMGEPAETIDPAAAEALGARGLRQLEQQGIPVESLDEALDAEATAQALAWLRGEGPCPSID